MNIYITFDYELFLSSNTGSVDNCLIKPTECIIDICNKFNVKTTFFVDTTYLCKAREYKELEKDVIRICNQLTILSKEGHSIQLHIHPQWFYSTYSNLEGWSMDYDHYKLSDCPIEDVNRMFDDGIALLKYITGKECNAYRAGGYSIQTLLNYAEFLQEKGFKIDSSCLCGKASKGRFQEYDYKGIRESNIYRFEDSIEFVNENGRFYELPITTFRISPISYMFRKRRVCKNPVVNFGDGKGIYTKLPFIRRIIKRLNLMMSPLYMSASIDRCTGIILGTIYRSLKERGNNDMTIIIHPKETTNYSLIFLEKFLSLTTRDACLFKTTEDILKTVITK